MVDHLKRRTLKVVTFGAAAISAPVVFNAPQYNTAIDSPGNKLLEMQIVTGSSTIEEAIILQNHSDQDITISQFLPNIITLKNRMLDLNELCKQPIVVKPGYPIASANAKWQPLNTDLQCSYLWCDSHAIELQANRSHNNKTYIIGIEAQVVNERALLTADSKIT